MELSLEGTTEIDGFAHIFLTKEGLNRSCKSFHDLYSAGCSLISSNKTKQNNACSKYKTSRYFPKITVEFQSMQYSFS